MNPMRRKIVVTLASLPLGFATGMAMAEGMTAGVEYRLVSPPLSPDNATKIEVIEFFSYACPACNAFEPTLEPWIRKLPGDVVFRRIPVVFHDTWLAPAGLYFALEVLGETGRLDQLVFDAIHKEHSNFSSPEPIAKFLESHGIPEKKFSEAYNSFSVQSKIHRGGQLQAAYKIDQVPEMAVDGRYVTANTMVGGKHEDVLPVVDYLVDLARKERRLPRA
jgi:thiol:disulfide interchange protein DsbA